MSPNPQDRSGWKKMELEGGKVVYGDPQILRFIEAYLLVNTVEIPDAMAELHYGGSPVTWPVVDILKFVTAFRDTLPPRRTLFIAASYNPVKEMFFFHYVGGKGIVHMSTKDHWERNQQYFKNFVGAAASFHKLSEEKLRRMGLLNGGTGAAGEAELPSIEDSAEEAAKKIARVKSGSSKK